MKIDMTEIWPVLAGWGARIVGAIAAVFLAWLVAGWAKRALLRRFEKSSFDVSMGRFFASLLRYLILAGALLGILGMFGVETASFAAVIAAIGLAIGLAFQGTLSNFAAGLMLLAFRPFKGGDFVKIADKTGTVAGIELFTSELTTLDNRRVIIPNSAVFGAVIENFTHHPLRRCDVSVGVEYAADIDRTRAVLERAIAGIPGAIPDPPAQVFLQGLAPSSVDWQVRVWCRTEDLWTVHEETVKRVKTALDEAGISIPFQQVDVNLREPRRDGAAPRVS